MQTKTSDADRTETDDPLNKLPKSPSLANVAVTAETTGSTDSKLRAHHSAQKVISERLSMPKVSRYSFA